MSLQHLVEILSLAKDAAKHDVKAVRLQPMHILRGLRWLVKTALMDDVATLLNNALIARGSTQPRDRKEAVPVPLWVLINWELHVIHPDTPDWTRLLLGGFLLACWGSLRYADLQRIQVTSLNLAIGALRGTCRMTKTTRSGQPFAVVTSGFVGDSPQSSWIYVWLKALQAAVYRSYPFCPDFIIPVLDHYHSPTGNAPLPYAAALKALRWAAQTPWGKPTLSAEQAHQLTLHSLKVTFLSAAAQLRLPESSRKLQGNHTGGSVQLYSRDDTIEALWVQSQVASAVRNGWRAVRPLQRGGQTPIPEPPILILMELSPLPKPFDMPMEDELEMFWKDPMLSILPLFAIAHRRQPALPRQIPLIRKHWRIRPNKLPQTNFCLSKTDQQDVAMLWFKHQQTLQAPKFYFPWTRMDNPMWRFTEILRDSNWNFHDSVAMPKSSM